MQERFRKHIETHFPEMLETTFLLACSGGMDSVALLHLCAGLQLRFEVAHCNFSLRGAESDEDTEFVRKLSENFQKEIHIKYFNTVFYCNKHKLTLQEGARQLRYGWFGELLKARGLAFVITAHHLDDQLETFLINLTRGSGLEGLAGIAARTPQVRRPLLPFTRKEIEAYAESYNLAWREDSSNLEDKYLRNRLRVTVIPALKEADARFDQNFAKTLRFLEGSRALLRGHIDQVRAGLFRREDHLIRIPVKALRRLHPRDAYLFELFRPYGFPDWQALGSLMESDPGKELQSKTHRLLKDRDSLLLKERSARDAGTFEIDLQVPFPKAPISLEISLVPAMGPRAANVLYADKETLKGGLQLRKWRKGDYFYPLGMQGRQKVSKYFKDHKLSGFEKESQWLLCSGHDIVWIVGRRADDRFKVTEGTTQIVRIEWTDAAVGES